MVKPIIISIMYYKIILIMIIIIKYGRNKILAQENTKDSGMR